MCRLVCPLLLLLASHPVVAGPKRPGLRGFGGRQVTFAGHAPFVLPASLSLRDELATASAVLAGKVSNPDKNGVTEFRIDGVVKMHPALKGKTVLALPPHALGEPGKEPPRVLIFF